MKTSKPYKSLLKMNDSNIMVNSNSNSYNNINSTTATNHLNSNPLINAVSSIPNSNNINQRNRVTISETDSNLLRKKLSFVNVSPKTSQNNNNGNGNNINNDANNYYMHHSATPVHHSFNSYTNALSTMEENHPKKKSQQYNLYIHSQTMARSQQ